VSWVALDYLQKGLAMRYASRLFESIFSLAVFLAIALAIGVVSYQLFNPDGSVASWLFQIWRNDPVLLVLLGGVVFLLKRWFGSSQSSNAADLMFYGMVTIGFFYGFKLLALT
jgi:ABC-type amino acid transport system permease subunit